MHFKTDRLPPCQHLFELTRPCPRSKVNIVRHQLIIKCSGTYLRHNRLPVLSLHISERHLSAFVLVELQFREVNIGDFVKRNWPSLVLWSLEGPEAFGDGNALLSWTTRRVTRTAVSVVICFGPNLRPSNPFFLSSEVRSDQTVH